LKNIKKLGLAIVCFEGMEHIPNILWELKGLIDYVVAGVQSVSYHGDPIDPSDLHFIKELKDRGDVNEIVFVETDLKKFARIQETDKRNMLIDHLQAAGCTHCLVIDSDEFYSRTSFENALKKIDEENLEVTYCRYVNYYKDYNTQLVYPFKDGMYVPFVSSCKYRFKWQCLDFPKPSDPTRRYEVPKVYVYDDKGNPVMTQTPDGKQSQKVHHLLVEPYEFPWKELKMHHLSWLRADIRKKLRCWSSRTYFKDADALTDQCVECFDKFPSLRPGERGKANVLFNTPDHTVDVLAFPRQYIFPHFDYRTVMPVLPVLNRKVVILSMTCNNPQYADMEKAILDTWAGPVIRGEVPNTEFWFYTAATDRLPAGVYPEEHKIRVDAGDAIENTYSKTMAVFDMLDEKGMKYDYIVRTNTSTWINVPLTRDFIANLHDDSVMWTGELEACFWSKMRFYGQGSFLIMSRTVTRRFKDYRHYDWEKVFKAYDDVILGATINAYSIRYGLDHRRYQKACGLSYYFDREPDIRFEDIRDRLCVRIKTETDDVTGYESNNVNRDREYDAPKMRKVHEVVSSRIDECVLPSTDQDRYDVVWIQDKQRWINGGYPFKKTSRGIYENAMIPYSEAVRRQKELGI